MKGWYKEEIRYKRRGKEWRKTGKKKQNETKIKAKVCDEIRNIQEKISTGKTKQNYE